MSENISSAKSKQVLVPKSRYAPQNQYSLISPRPVFINQYQIIHRTVSISHVASRAGLVGKSKVGNELSRTAFFI
jgi:hypothetical protein